jgi:hypothetical protein
MRIHRATAPQDRRTSKDRSLLPACDALQALPVTRSGNHENAQASRGECIHLGGLMKVSSGRAAGGPVCCRSFGCAGGRARQAGRFPRTLDLDFGGDDVATLAFTNGDTRT